MIGKKGEGCQKWLSHLCKQSPPSPYLNLALSDTWHPSTFPVSQHPCHSAPSCPPCSSPSAPCNIRAGRCIPPYPSPTVGSDRWRLPVEDYHTFVWSLVPESVTDGSPITPVSSSRVQARGKIGRGGVKGMEFGRG